MEIECIHLQSMQPFTEDDYATPKEALEEIAPFVKPNLVIYDPFYFDGSVKPLLKEVFRAKRVIHEKRDAYTWMPKGFDIIITNPPFTHRERVLRFLLSTGKPFMCLLPNAVLSRKYFPYLPDVEKVQILVNKGRIHFNREGKRLDGSSMVDCFWFCYKMGLPRDIMFTIQGYNGKNYN